LKKILILSRDFDHKGGVVGYVKLLLRNLSQENFHVRHFIQGRSSDTRKNVFLPLVILKQFYNFKRVLKKYRPDLVHINPSFRVVSLIRDSIYLNIAHNYSPHKTLVLFHGWESDFANMIAKNFFFRKLFLKTYRKPGMILVLCNDFKKQLVDIGIKEDKIEVVTTMYQRKKDVEPIEDKKRTEKIGILFMSRLEESKGVYIAAEVGRHLVDSGFRDFRLIFAGDGPEYLGLKGYIEENELDDNLDAVGYVRGSEKWEILDRCDIFLYPTFYGEGCPLVILEAMGAGLAVVSTPVAAIPDIVLHNESGFIVDSKNPVNFFEAVKELIENRELLEQMQEKNKLIAEANYEANVVTKKIERIYASIIVANFDPKN
jgi:glycosyltransferase involved in cell wall biosynthesis